MTTKQIEAQTKAEKTVERHQKAVIKAIAEIKKHVGLTLDENITCNKVRNLFDKCYDLLEDSQKELFNDLDNKIEKLEKAKIELSECQRITQEAAWRLLD